MRSEISRCKLVGGSDRA